MLNKNVFVVGAGNEESSMFYREGFNIVASPGKADIVVFCGGGDIDPFLYHQKQISENRFNDTIRKRDEAEIKCYQGLSVDQIKVGICRGGQLLNVLNGGSMYQDVNNHEGGKTHKVLIKGEKEYCWLNSYHHQMMIPNFEAEDLSVLGISCESSTRKTDKGTWTGQATLELDPDFEILWYENTHSFCFQPHPEWGSDSEHNQTRNAFFRVLTHLKVI